MSIIRSVVSVPEGHFVREVIESEDVPSIDPERKTLGDSQQAFWKEFLDHLVLDDPDQAKPKPARQGYVTFSLPAPGGSSWLTVYRDLHQGQVGVFLSSSRNSAGEYAMQTIANDWERVKDELGRGVRLTEKDGRPQIIDSFAAGPLGQPEVRRRAFAWLSERVNAFVNVMRPRVRSAVTDFQLRQSGS